MKALEAYERGLARWNSQLRVRGDHHEGRRAELARIQEWLAIEFARLDVEYFTMEWIDQTQLVNEINQAMLGDEIPPGHEYIDEGEK